MSSTLLPYRSLATFAQMTYLLEVCHAESSLSVCVGICDQWDLPVARIVVTLTVRWFRERLMDLVFCRGGVCNSVYHGGC